MTPILTWFPLATCSFLLAKSYIENLFRPFGGLPSVCRKLWREDPENTDEEKWELEKVPDEFIGAFLYTMLLIFTLVLWPVVLCVIIWFKIFPLDMTELEEYK